MKLMFEKILPSDNTSWRYWKYELDNIPFNWHYHPEYEIALTLNSVGQRYVGDSIETYDEFDMAFLGPHLPHTWCSEPSVDGKMQTVYVAQIPVAWLERLVHGMPDLESFKSLLEMSKRGVKFSRQTVQQAASIFALMQDAVPSARFIALMQILQIMLNDKAKTVLASSGFSLELTADESSNKLDKVIRYIHANYSQTIRAEEVAELVHMSTNHFHRFFKQRTEQTFTEVVNQLRISKACSLLVNTSMPIYTICDTCGFNNISNFNRRFLQFKAMKPSEYRRLYADKSAMIVV